MFLLEPAAWLLLYLRCRMHHHVAIPISMPAPITTPTPMPAFAPVLRSLFCTATTPLCVGMMVAGAHLGDPDTAVQKSVSGQQPPPRVEGQAIWLVVQPAGSWVTMAFTLEEGVLVLRQTLVPQAWP